MTLPHLNYLRDLTMMRKPYENVPPLIVIILICFFLGAKRMQDEVYVLDESSMAAEDLLFMIKTEQHETWLLPFFNQKMKMTTTYYLPKFGTKKHLVTSGKFWK